MPETEYTGGALLQTPSQTVGPFYGYALPYEGDAHAAPPWHADAVRLHGTVTDGAGDPIPDAILEVWGADASGRPYTAPGNFRRDGRTATGFGRASTDASGHYAFTTVKPGASADDRAPYLLVTVFARGLLHHLFTRAYFADEAARNELDPTLAVLTPERRATLIAAADEERSYRFDVRLQGEGETVFFDFGLEGEVSAMDPVEASDGVFDWGLLEPAADAGQGASDDAVLEAMVEVEQALVLARAAGSAEATDPDHADAAPARAAAVAARLDAATLDRAALRAGTRSGGVAVIELVAQLRAQAGAADAALVHTGATSQDVVDTALVLVSREVLATASVRLRAAGRPLAALADRERDRPIVARTLGQPAEPTTFGVAVAGWLDAVCSALETLDATRFPVQLGGAIGTGEAFVRSAGRLDAADRTRARLAAQLGLDDPGRSWHTDRSPVLAISGAAALVCAAAGRIGRDLALAARDGLAAPAHGGGSSSMPHKRNPVDAVILTANALRAPGAIATLQAAAVSSDFRPSGEWHAEWQAWRGLLRLAAESAEVLAHAASDLVVAPVATADGTAPAGPLDPTTAAIANAIVDRALARFAALDQAPPDRAALDQRPPAHLDQKGRR